VLLCLGFRVGVQLCMEKGRKGGGEEETRVSGTAAPSRLVSFSSH
jgi:hypothetical protein